MIQQIRRFSASLPGLVLIVVLTMTTAFHGYTWFHSLIGVPTGDKFVCNAAATADVRAIRRGIDSGISINCRDDLGFTPLHYAIISGRVEAVQAVLDAGGDLSIATNNGNSPLFVAIATRKIEIVRVLLRAGADPNECRDSGLSPLDAALMMDEPELVRVLRDAGARLKPSRASRG